MLVGVVPEAVNLDPTITPADCHATLLPIVVWPNVPVRAYALRIVGDNRATKEITIAVAAIVFCFRGLSLLK